MRQYRDSSAECHRGSGTPAACGWNGNSSEHHPTNTHQASPARCNTALAGVAEKGHMQESRLKRLSFHSRRFLALLVPPVLPTAPSLFCLCPPCYYQEKKRLCWGNANFKARSQVEQAAKTSRRCGTGQLLHHNSFK